MYAGSPLGLIEEDPQTKQAVLNTIANGGKSLRTPMPSAAAASASTTTIATVLNKKAGEHPHLRCTSSFTSPPLLQRLVFIQPDGSQGPAVCCISADFSCATLCALTLGCSGIFWLSFFRLPAALTWCTTCPGGKRGAAAAESMVVTCADGEVVTVNMKTGLGSVPARYQKEVAAQLEALKKLATAALTNVTKRR